MSKNYYVYILTNQNNSVFYVGVTNSLERRLKQHKSKEVRGFTSKYDVTKLVYYESDSNVLKQIKNYFPAAIENNKINRNKLGKLVLNDKEKLQILESIIHPQVKKLQNEFIKKCHKENYKAVILNIPLLFEKGGYKQCDKNILVTVPEDVQKQRFLQRIRDDNSEISIDEANKKLQKNIKNQMSNAEKSKLADFVIFYSSGKVIFDLL